MRGVQGQEELCKWVCEGCARGYKVRRSHVSECARGMRVCEAGNWHTRGVQGGVQGQEEPCKGRARLGMGTGGACKNPPCPPSSDHSPFLSLSC